MRIDNSALKVFQFCPAYYQERYVHKIEPKVQENTALTFGKVFHRLLEGRLKGELSFSKEELFPEVSESIWDECIFTYEKYCQQYPQEDWETIDVERLVEVPLTGMFDGMDVYVAKMDWVARSPEGLRIIDHKTEERGSLNNSLQRWQYLTQVSLYQWAAEQYYHEPIYGITIDLISRRSLKGRCEPEFQRFTVQRTPWQQKQAVETLRYCVEQIKFMQSKEWTDGLWPQNRDNCQKWRWTCAYAALHGEDGRDENILMAKFQAAEEYLI